MAIMIKSTVTKRGSQFEVSRVWVDDNGRRVTLMERGPSMTEIFALLQIEEDRRGLKCTVLGE